MKLILNGGGIGKQVASARQLLNRKIDNLESQSTQAGLYAEALRAFSTYSGNKKEDDDFNDEQ